MRGVIRGGGRRVGMGGGCDAQSRWVAVISLGFVSGNEHYIGVLA